MSTIQTELETATAETFDTVQADSRVVARPAKSVRARFIEWLDNVDVDGQPYWV